jgi:acyl-[acyl-carrier-protein]-phospholipid O-acyltransferase/long-chain-fatty-acid--[acyl-carrier-protein] ligase
VGIPDATKGEALALVTAVEITTEMLRDRLGGAGLPNLWIPKIIVRVERIPLMETGKLDLNACRLRAIAAARN